MKDEQQTAEDLLKDMLESVFQYGAVLGPHAQLGLMETLISGLIASYATMALPEKPDSRLPPDKNKEIATKRYKELKDNLEAAIATGFGTAVQAATKWDIEYYCVLKMVPEPQNKIPV